MRFKYRKGKPPTVRNNEGRRYVTLNERLTQTHTNQLTLLKKVGVIKTADQLHDLVVSLDKTTGRNGGGQTVESVRIDDSPYYISKEDLDAERKELETYLEDNGICLMLPPSPSKTVSWAPGEILGRLKNKKSVDPFIIRPVS